MYNFSSNLLGVKLAASDTLSTAQFASIFFTLLGTAMLFSESWVWNY